MMSRFPHLPETFILREMNALAARGFEVEVVPLVVQREGVVHAAAAAWMSRLPRYGAASLRRLPAAALYALRRPRRAMRVAAQSSAGNRGNPKFLLRGLAVLVGALALADRLERSGVDHVHAHYATHPALFAWIVHQLTGIPYSVTAHAHDIFVDRTMLATKLSGASFVVTISRFNADLLKRALEDAALPPLHVVHCGVPIDELAHDHALWPGSGPLRILAIGSLQPYKGHRYLIEACSRLVGRLDVACTIVGEGPERGQLERQLQLRGLEGRVRLAGAKTEQEVSRLLREAHIYVHPSVKEPSGKMEGIPVALMEAMAAGVPVIATRLSGVPELVRDQETGVLVDPESPDQLAAAVEAVARAPRTVIEARTRRARELVSTEFDLEKNVARLAGLMASRPNTHAFRPAVAIGIRSGQA